MKNLAIVFILALAVTGCTSARTADFSTPQSKPKVVHAAKVKTGAAPVSIAPQVAPAKKQKVKKQKDHWWQIWR